MFLDTESNTNTHSSYSCKLLCNDVIDSDSNMRRSVVFWIYAQVFFRHSRIFSGPNLYTKTAACIQLTLLIHNKNTLIIYIGCCYMKPLLVPGGRAFAWPAVQRVQR